MARALQQAEYSEQAMAGEQNEPVEFTGGCGDVAYDEQIARELQMQDWQQEEKKKRKEDDEAEEGKKEAKAETDGSESSACEEDLKGVDKEALKKFIAEHVQRFFDQKLSEILNPALWAAYGA